jgi:outer membrane protein assembly factor BamB
MLTLHRLSAYIASTGAIALALANYAFGDDWPQFRGPNGDGVSKATSAPLHWTATEHVLWKQEIPGTGWSSPVLSRGNLYLTSAVEEDSGAVSLRAICIAPQDGKIKWNVEVLRPELSAAKAMHSKNSLASPTPIVNGDHLYVHFGHMGTAALDLEGNVVWTQTALNYRPRHGNGGSPVLVEDLLVFSCDAEQDPFLAALDRSSGEIRWKTERQSPAVKKFSFSTPLVIEVDGAKQIISPGSGHVGAYDPRDGREIWRVNYGEGYSVVPRPVFANGLLYVLSGFDKAVLLAIDPRGATGDVTETHVRWTHAKGAPLTPSVVVVDKELYLVSDNGVASCLDAMTGKVHWTERLGGNFSASPISAAGRIYAQSEDGVTHVFAADTTFEELATNDIEERTLASPAVDDHTLFLRSESHLWCIGEPGGLSSDDNAQPTSDGN